MIDIAKLIITLSSVSFVLQLLIVIVQRKSQYLPLFIVLVAGEALSTLLRRHMPYENFSYVLSYSLALPSMLQVYWKKKSFWMILIPFLFIALSIPLINSYYRFIVIAVTSSAAAIYILLRLLSTGFEQYRISAYLVVLFFYMIIPDLKMYFVLSGEKINEVFFITVVLIDFVITISFLFLRENHPKHNFIFASATKHDEIKP